MKPLLMAGAIIFCSGLAALAEGFTFGGSGRDHPYPNEPQYQYSYPYTNSRSRSAQPCPRGQAPFQGTCRTIRWLPGSAHRE